eukprot:11858810-Prorocentrum_lima.AAC.1
MNSSDEVGKRCPFKDGTPAVRISHGSGYVCKVSVATPFTVLTFINNIDGEVLVVDVAASWFRVGTISKSGNFLSEQSTSETDGLYFLEP